MNPPDPNPPRPIVGNAVFYLVLLFGLASILSSPANPLALLQGAVFLIAAWGMRRGRAWSAYGLALLIAITTGMFFLNAALGRQELTGMQSAALKFAALFSSGIVILLFFAGRALEQTDGRRGLAWPWISASVAIGGFLALFGLYQTPTASMENTLLVGDRIAVWRTYGDPPRRGQLVTHVYPVNRKDTFLKRVIAVPGDRVRIRNKQLFVNGAPVSEPYVIHKTDYVDNYRDNFPSDPNIPLYPGGREMLDKNVINGEVVVPPGHYFVLGDNRDMLLDSRYWGFIAQSDIVGTPKFVYYSVEQDSQGNVRGLPILHVRWGRLFHPVS